MPARLKTWKGCNAVTAITCIAMIVWIFTLKKYVSAQCAASFFVKNVLREWWNAMPPKRENRYLHQIDAWPGTTVGDSNPRLVLLAD
jgi:hypothetical protein